MNHMLIPPQEPRPSDPIRPPNIYVNTPLKWEYKLVVQDLERQAPLDEVELNALGKEGWEMTGIAQQPPNTYFYFKRQVEK